MKTRKEKYQNIQTKEIKEFVTEVDENSHIPMYRYEDENEWKVVSKWTLNIVNSSEFFRSGHENTVRFHSDPLDGSDFPYRAT
jgi:hypothetical protein